MAIIVILFIVGVAAMAVLLGCLRGFSRAGKQEKVVGLLLRAEQPSGGRQYLKVRHPLEIRNYAGLVNDTTLARTHISKETVALVDLAIVLGSRSASSDRPPRTLHMPDHDGKTEGTKRLQARGR